MSINRESKHGFAPLINAEEDTASSAGSDTPVPEVDEEPILWENRCAYDEAGFFSKMFISWVTPLVKVCL